MGTAVEYITATDLEYLDDLDLYKIEKPYVCTLEPWNTPGADRNNLAVSPHEMTIKDIRPHLKDFSTDVHGFQVETFPTELTGDELRDEEAVHARYCPEVEDFLKRRFGAQNVHIFDVTFRKIGMQKKDPTKQLRNTQILGAAIEVHVDQTPDSARRRVEEAYPGQVDRFFAGRVRILNVWRPLVTPLLDHPLAVCDYRSTDPADYIACDVPSPSYVGESYLLHHNPKHDWWFLKEMQRDEVFVIKMYDSDAERPGGGSTAKCTPHTSFVWKDTPQDAPKRESVEIRAIIFG